MNTTTNPVAVGDKIIPLPINDGDWYSLPEWYRDKIGTVTYVYSDFVTAEFTSQQKPDDSVNWNVMRWRKRPTEGDTVRVIDPDHTYFGRIGTIKTDDTTTLPYWVLGLNAADPDDGEWLRHPQVEVVQDGETLTTSYTPVVGDWVRVTGVLTDDGVIDTQVYHGVVIEASNDVYVVQHERCNSVITGPGYITKAEFSGDYPVGSRVQVKIDGDWPDSLLGAYGIVTGRYSSERLYVTFPRSMRQYGNVFPGSWCIPDEALEFQQISDAVEPTVSELQRNVLAQAGTIEELQRQLQRANERVTEYADRAGKWERDFMRSWERIGREATERSWCSEYESVCNDVAEDLEIGVIPPRITLVEKRIRIRGEVFRDVTVWVQEGEDATDPDNWYDSNDLDDKCSEDFVTETLDSEYGNNGWDETGASVLR